MPGAARERFAVPPRPLLLAALPLAACAAACTPAREQTDATRAPLIGAAASEPCAWSSAALLLEGDSLCSGVLVHPRVVAYAGHCGTDFTVARFGTGDVRRAVPIARCEAHPDCGDVCEGGSFVGGDPWDYGACLLDEPATGAAAVPPMMGCELDALVRDATGVVVGFGRDDDAMAGLKRELEMDLASRNDGRNEVVWAARDEGQGLCAGDSGGPTYVRLADGSWRVASIHHGRDDPCGRAFDRVLAPAVPWIEAAFSVDVTPCHDAEGRWTPTAACRGFATDPGGDHGAYPDCTAGPVDSSPGRTCGPPFDAIPDAGPASDGGPGGLDASTGGDAGAGDPGDPAPGVEGGCAAAGAPPGAALALTLLAGACRGRRRRRRA